MDFYSTVLRELSDRNIRFIVVGGVATVLHGYARLTVDLDLVVDFAGEHLRDALVALTALGFKPRVPVNALDFADPAIRRGWIEQKGMMVFSMWRDDEGLPLVVDLFAEEPFPFDEMFDRGRVVSVGGREIRIASRKDLITMKQKAGRPKDLIDIAQLEQLDD
ncbi:MAG TPA: nucleotidyl transferase AbiEii/AbiGii toxin family protein [Thermoanaerobaculia bacterium]|nr:nucleotidyl transferase AbiEii/AbiGii toxin family protein [Thermoanaerobaculia bacterium]